MHKKGAVDLLIYGLPVLIIMGVAFTGFSLYFKAGGLDVQEFAAPETEEQIFTLTTLLNTPASLNKDLISKELIFKIKEAPDEEPDTIGISCVLKPDNKNEWIINIYDYINLKEGQCLIDTKVVNPEYLTRLDINPLLNNLKDKNCKEGQEYLKKNYQAISGNFIESKTTYSHLFDTQFPCFGPLYSQDKSTYEEIVSYQENKRTNLKTYKELILEAQKNPTLQENIQAQFLELFAKLPRRPGFNYGADRTYQEMYWQLKVTNYNLKEKKELNTKIYGSTYIAPNKETTSNKQLYFPTEDPNVIIIIELYEVYNG